MPSSDEVVDAKIAAAEARTETKFARLEGTLGLLAQNIETIANGVSAARAEAHVDAQATKHLVIGTALAVFFGTVGSILAALSWGGQSFSSGMDSAGIARAAADDAAAKAADASFDRFKEFVATSSTQTPNPPGPATGKPSD